MKETRHQPLWASCGTASSHGSSRCWRTRSGNSTRSTASSSRSAAVRPQDHMGAYRWCSNGCPPCDRLAMCKAFIGKTVWNFDTTSGPDRRHPPPSGPAPAVRLRRSANALGVDLLARLRRIRQKRVPAGNPRGDGQGPLWRQARRARQPRRTAIRAREKAAAKPETAPPRARQRGRRRKGEPRRRRRIRHGCNCKLNRGLKENLADLPASCDWGCKKNSKGKTECWRGYKAHLDVIDGDIPVSFILTSASLHDSQAAIPLAQMTAGRIVNLYDLADAAYDAKEIREMSARLGHVALIDHNPRRGEKIEFSRRKPGATTNARPSSASTAICTKSTADGTSGCAARRRWRRIWPSGCWSSPPSRCSECFPDRPRGRLPSLKTRPRPGGGAGVCPETSEKREKRPVASVFQQPLRLFVRKSCKIPCVQAWHGHPARVSWAGRPCHEGVLQEPQYDRVLSPVANTLLCSQNRNRPILHFLIFTSEQHKERSVFGNTALATLYLSGMKTIHSAEYRALLGWLREQRQSRGLTMRAVAAKLDVPHSWVCKIETGERRLDVCEYLALCQAIGCDYQKGMRMLMDARGRGR